MKILALIPARGGSKGIPGKNSKFLGGKPLIGYTIESAKQSKLLSEIVVSTDSNEIFQVAQELGCKPPFLRPLELAQDTSTSLEVVQHAVAFFEAQYVFYDAICLLQPTNPFREEGFIDDAINKFISSKADCLISVLPVPHEYNPHWTFEENESGLLKIATGEETIISRRQDLPITFHRDGAIYITKTNVIKAGSLYGETISFVESNPKFYINIDTMQDWHKAEDFIIKNRL
jgi:N-acylneuraminate cytidylyltransferase